MGTSFAIGKHRVGRAHRPFVIAELSGNHNQSLDRALDLVRAAANCGVQAVKLQTYTADTMTLDLCSGEFVIDDPKSLWNGRSLYDLYEEAHTPWEWHRPIIDLCKRLGMECFSTPFDSTSIDFLESLEVPAYKVASFEMTDLALIRKIASTGKPMIISTGMATVAEIEETVHEARKAGCRDVVLLKCTSSYPAPPDASNLRTIPHLRDLFECEVGLSDHTLGIGVSVVSVAFGATVIEKHLTLKRADGGPDAAFSLEPEEMKALTVEIERAWRALGAISYGATSAEGGSVVFRRSLYIAEDMKVGEIFTEKNLRAIRPGFGLAPKYFEFFLGKSVRRDAKRGTPTSWDLLFEDIPKQ